MIKTIFSTLAVVLTIGAAHAQAPDSTADSTADARVKSAHAAAGSPGTVSAMQTATWGIATSAQDVVLQQQGRSTAAEGARPRAAQAQVSGYSAGTVGAGLTER